MTVRERVLTSRLIQKIDSHSSYAKSIGIDYTVTSVQAGKNKSSIQAVKAEKAQ